MENASKALLIAAGVLIVILVIAISMRIFNSSNGVADDADKVGESISSKTTEASKDAINSLSKNLINIPDRYIDLTKGNTYSQIYTTDFKLEVGKKYRIKFDYETQNIKSGISFRIGLMSRDPDFREGYVSTKIYQGSYQQEAKKNVTYDFVAKDEWKDKYFAIDFLCDFSDYKKNGSIKISNIQLIEIR